MKKKILIIDDNDQDRKIIERFVRKAGYEDVITAGTGEEGLDKTKTEKPDLIITDTLLPGTDGFEVCRSIRETHGADNPKVIIITGSVDAVDAVKAKKAGADDYCAKTSDFSPLIDAIKKLFEEIDAI